MTVSEFFSQDRTQPLLDVRTPSEFQQGHIPGAKNLPLFSNEERAEIGTLYKQVSPEKAYLRGLEIAGSQLADYVKLAFRLAPGRRATVHCWRGGKRSGSLAALLDFSGFEVQVLTGGYKAYRQFVLEQFANRQLRFVVLGGKTGSGKTETLGFLKEKGEQVIDLERLAHHKGSAFGALGEAAQPTVEQFENDLFEAFSKIDPNRRVWVENESRGIGRVFVPQGFWEQMKSAPLIHVEMPFERRVERLIADYAAFPPAELEECLLKIERKMGGQFMKAALDAFRANDLSKATGIALDYYDKTYLHATSKGNFCQRHELQVSDEPCREIATRLIEFANEHHF